MTKIRWQKPMKNKRNSNIKCLLLKSCKNADTTFLHSNDEIRITCERFLFDQHALAVHVHGFIQHTPDSNFIINNFADFTKCAGKKKITTVLSKQHLI